MTEPTNDAGLHRKYVKARKNTLAESQGKKARRYGNAATGKW